MTIQEALKWMKTIKGLYKPLLKEANEACDVAIQALEKQISKKPIKGKNGDLSCFLWFDYSKKNRRTCLHYCHNCGQAIDWSDED